MIDALEKGEMVNVLEKGEKFDMFDQANFSQEKILPSFFPPFFKGGLGGIRGEHRRTFALFLVHCQYNS